MMQMRDWISGFIGLIIGGIGLLSLIGFSPYDFSRNVLIWLVALAGFYLVINAVIEITNSNIMGTVSLVIAFVALAVSVFPIFSGFGWLGAWAEFNLLGAAFYKIVMVVEGFFLMIATFAMEL